MVETTRLKIFPLNYRQLLAYLSAGDILEDELGLKRTNRTISGSVKEMVDKFTLPKMQSANADNYLFFTFWIVVDKLQNTIVAELGFKGEPNHRGEIEIGYGTIPPEQGKGYMTEAVSGMINWAIQRADVNWILAETDRHNARSIRVVQNNGFEQFDIRGEMLWWRRNVDFKS